SPDATFGTETRYTPGRPRWHAKRWTERTTAFPEGSWANLCRPDAGQTQNERGCEVMWTANRDLGLRERWCSWYSAAERRRSGLGLDGPRVTPDHACILRSLE